MRRNITPTQSHQVGHTWRNFSTDLRPAEHLVAPTLVGRLWPRPHRPASTWLWCLETERTLAPRHFRKGTGGGKSVKTAHLTKRRPAIGERSRANATGRCHQFRRPAQAGQAPPAAHSL